MGMPVSETKCVTTAYNEGQLSYHLIEWKKIK